MASNQSRRPARNLKEEPVGLYQETLAAAAGAALYTVPENKVLKPDAPIITNTDVVDRVVTMYYVPPVVGVGQPYTVLDAHPVRAKATITPPLYYSMGAGWRIFAFADAPNVVDVSQSGTLQS